MSEKPHELALTLKALRVVTMKHRLRTLRSLLDRRCTLGEIVTAVDLPKTTVHNHLKALERDRFISRHQEGAWVYYELTDLGRAIAESDRIQVTILLGSSAVSLTIAATILAIRARLTVPTAREGWLVEPIPPAPAGIERAELLILGLALLSLSITLLVLALLKRRRSPSASDRKATG